MRNLKAKFEIFNVKHQSGIFIIALLPDLFHQKVSNLRFLSKPPDQIVYYNDYNKIALWKNSDYVGFEFNIELINKSISDFKANAPEFISSDVHKRFIKSERFMEQTEEIMDLSNNITSGCSSDFEKARSIFYWQIQNMKQCGKVITGPGAINAYNDLDGNCGSFVSLFVTLCRCQKIPARIIMGGLALKNSTGYHAWAEVYLNDYGWIPVDSSIANSLKDRKYEFASEGFPIEPNFYFGGISDRSIVFSEGMNFNLKEIGLSIPNELTYIDFFQPGADIYFDLPKDTRRSNLKGWWGLFYLGSTNISEDEIKREFVCKERICSN